jgi:hypothetical protein
MYLSCVGQPNEKLTQQTLTLMRTEARTESRFEIRANVSAMPLAGM